MSDKPRSVGISSVGPLLTFTATDLEHDLLVRYEQGTIWLTQALMGELFGVDKRTVSEHLRNIFASRELDGDSVVRKIRTTADDGKNYQVKHYNLDAIISVGYRVNSKRATQGLTHRLQKLSLLQCRTNCITRYMVTPLQS